MSEICDIKFKNNPSFKEDCVINQLNYFISQEAFDLAQMYGRKVTGIIDLRTEEWEEEDE